MSKSVSRPIVGRRRGGAFWWHFDLACGHSMSTKHPSEREKEFKTMSCYKCASGECVNHDWKETESGATCKVCGVTG